MRSQADPQQRGPVGRPPAHAPAGARQASAHRDVRQVTHLAQPDQTPPASLGTASGCCSQAGLVAALAARLRDCSAPASLLATLPAALQELLGCAPVRLWWRDGPQLAFVTHDAAGLAASAEGEPSPPAAALEGLAGEDLVCVPAGTGGGACYLALRRREELHGVLRVGCPDASECTPTPALRALGAYLQLALDHAFTVESVAALSGQLTALQGTLSAFGQSRGAVDVARVVVEHIRAHLGFDRVAVFVAEWDSDRVHQICGVDEAGELDLRQEVRFPLDTPHPVQQVIRGEEPFIVSNDVPSDPRWAGVPGAPDARAHAAVPMRSRGAIIGAIVVDNLHSGRRIEQSHLRLLQTFADQAGAAVENALLFERLRRRNRYMDAVHRVAAVVHSSASFDEIMQTTARAAADVVEADAALLTLADEAAGVLEGRVGHRIPEELVSDTVRRLYHEPHPDEDAMAWVWRTGEALRLLGEDDARLHRGTVRKYDLHRSARLMVPMRSRGHVLGVLGVARDAQGLAEGQPFSREDQETLQALADQAAIALENITLQEQMALGEKLRALGELASGVAHGFNNLLTGILGAAQLLLARTSDPDLSRWLRVIERSALDGAATVRRIQEYTRQSPVEEGDLVVLHELVPEVLDALRPVLDRVRAEGHPVRVAVECDAVPPVKGSPARLREALNSLVANAIEAMPEGGALTCRTRTDGRWVEAEVSDTGVGIAPELQRRIFDPFFSTKTPPNAGLGLSTACGTARRHGGDLTCASAPGEGTTFVLRLPATQAAAPPAPPPTPEVAAVGARVLIVDDEELVAETVAALARSCGHEVDTAIGGAAGVAACATSDFDLVITDLGMPDLPGWEVARQVKALHPQTRVMLLTGWGAEVGEREARSSSVDRVLTKPVSLERLHQAISETLLAA